MKRGKGTLIVLFIQLWQLWWALAIPSPIWGVEQKFEQQAFRSFYEEGAIRLSYIVVEAEEGSFKNLSQIEQKAEALLKQKIGVKVDLVLSKRITISPSLRNIGNLPASTMKKEDLVEEPIFLHNYGSEIDQYYLTLCSNLPGWRCEDTMAKGLFQHKVFLAFRQAYRNLYVRALPHSFFIQLAESRQESFILTNIPVFPDAGYSNFETDFSGLVYYSEVSRHVSVYDGEEGRVAIEKAAWLIARFFASSYLRLAPVFAPRQGCLYSVSLTIEQAFNKAMSAPFCLEERERTQTVLLSMEVGYFLSRKEWQKAEGVLETLKTRDYYAGILATIDLLSARGNLKEAAQFIRAEMERVRSRKGQITEKELNFYLLALNAELEFIKRKMKR